MRPLVVLGLLLFPLLAACLSNPSPDCEGEACDSPTPTDSEPTLIVRPPGVPFPPLPIMETLRSARLENCTGASGQVEVSEQRLRSHVPNDFRFVDVAWVPGNMVVFWRALSCDRITIAGKIFDDYAEVMFGAEVQPKNESWEVPPGASRYILDYYSNNGVVADSYTGLGIPVESAVITVSPVQGVSSVVNWVVNANSSSVKISYPMQEQALAPQNGTNYFWTGDDVYLRITLSIDLIYNGELSAASLQFDGNSDVASIVAAPSAQGVARPHADIQIAWIVTETLYFGGN